MDLSKYTKADFYGDEDVTRCVYDKDGLLGATLPKLVLKLTSPENTISIDAFLLTYRSFTTPDTLVECLAARCEQADPSELSVVRFRVCTLLSKWIDRYTFDFIKDCPALHEKVKLWLERMVGELLLLGDKTFKVPEQVLGKLEKIKAAGFVEKGQVLDQIQTKYPKPIMPKDPEGPLLKCNMEELARQITIREWNVWKECKPWHFLGLAWTKGNNSCSPLLKLINQFNALSDWVAATLCTTEDLKQRSKHLLSFLTLAGHLKRLNNINGLMAILSGLQRGPLMRLHLTEEMARQKDAKTFETYAQLQDLTASTKSYKNLRMFMTSLTPPCIPYVGMYLSDLTFIEEGNPDRVGEHKLINIFKRLLISKSISELRLYQITAYHFTEIPSILAKLDQTIHIEEKALYELSYFLEPREGKEPGPRPELLSTLQAQPATKSLSSKKSKWKLKSSLSQSADSNMLFKKFTDSSGDEDRDKRHTESPVTGSEAESGPNLSSSATNIPNINNNNNNSNNSNNNSEVTTPRGGVTSGRARTATTSAAWTTKEAATEEDEVASRNARSASARAGGWMVSRQRSALTLNVTPKTEEERDPESPSVKPRKFNAKLVNAASSCPASPASEQRAKKDGETSEDSDTRSVSPFMREPERLHTEIPPSPRSSPSSPAPPPKVTKNVVGSSASSPSLSSSHPSEKPVPPPKLKVTARKSSADSFSRSASSPHMARLPPRSDKTPSSQRPSIALSSSPKSSHSSFPVDVDVQHNLKSSSSSLPLDVGSHHNLESSDVEHHSSENFPVDHGVYNTPTESNSYGGEPNTLYTAPAHSRQGEVDWNFFDGTETTNDPQSLAQAPPSLPPLPTGNLGQILGTK
eukprot:TRINITY_DN14141_c0_g1_i1.p1 TRINITY_DN14141_c0_g1~~TRINITY_DN14141_c0_g1_i1.p1  ORF type:complete len:872 (+),score=176.95 TRINITY_DN14141_c0_g1_i1:29-2617(+)